MAIHYRLFQLVRALTGRISNTEQHLINSLLQAGEHVLFSRMARFDQRHCLDVCQTLQRAGYADRALLQAALIHDAGKVNDRGQPIPLLYYGLFVVLLRVAPALYQRAAANGRGFLWPFAIHTVHEQRSIALAEAANSSPEVIEILRDYAAHRASPSASALLWADDQN